MKRLRSNSGFTLMELVIVVLIIGVLAAFGVPQYFKTVETTKADDAAAMVQMAGTTHRMYALDHSNGFLSTGGAIATSCNSTACSGTGTDRCQLVACKYMAQQDFDKKAYTLTLKDGAAAASTFSCNGSTSSSKKWTAYACRRTSGAGSTGVAPYANWGYGVDDTGVIENVGGAPSAVAP